MEIVFLSCSEIISFSSFQMANSKFIKIVLSMEMSKTYKLLYKKYQ